MKPNRLGLFLLLLLANAGVCSPTQQNDTDRKLLADVRAKAEKGDAVSQYELGNSFAFGELGVTKDAVLAMK